MSVLPDRERRHLLQFHVMPRLDYGRRILIAAILIGAGILLQAVVYAVSVEAALVLGAVVLFAGNSFLLLKGYDLSPGVVRGGEWERTTLDRFREVLRLERDVSRWDSALVDISCGKGFLSLVGFVLAPVALVMVVVASVDPEWQWLALLVGLDAAVLVVPHWLTGIRRKWKPVALRERVQALLDAVETARSADGPTPRFQPTFLVHGDGEERVPIDARVFLKYPDAPDDFLGVQFQVAVNLVQGTNYPYFYAVIVARPGFGLLDRSGAIERAADGLTVETDREDDAEVVVIRQTTTKNSGYHTNARAVRGIAAAAVAAAAALLGSPTRP